MKIHSSYTFPSDSELLEALVTTQKQLTEASKEYVEADFNLARSRALIHLEMLSVVRQENGQLVHDTEVIKRIRKDIAKHVSAILDKRHLKPAA